MALSILNNYFYYGDNIYHINEKNLPPLIKALIDYYNDQSSDNYNEILNNLSDFENSYNFDKNLLYQLIIEDKAYNPNLSLLEEFYEYYENMLSLYNFQQKIENLEKIAELAHEGQNIENLQTCEEYAFAQKICNYTGDDETLKKLWQNAKETGDFSILIQYYINQELMQYNQLLQNYFNSKYTYVLDLLSYVDETNYKLKPEYKSYQVLKQFEKNIDFNYLTNILINSKQNIKTNLVDLNNETIQETVNNINESTSAIILLNNLYKHDISGSIEDLNEMDEINNDIEYINSMKAKLTPIQTKLENNKDLTDSDINTLKELSSDSTLTSLSNKIISLQNNIKTKNENILYLQSSFYNKIVFGGLFLTQVKNLSERYSNISSSIENKLNDIYNYITDNDVIQQIKDVLLVAGGIYTLLNVINDPRGVIKSLINLLVTPLEAIMGALDVLICSIKELLCKVVSLVKTLGNFVTFIGNIITKFSQTAAEKIDNFVSSWKSDKSSEMNTNYYNLVTGYQSALTRELSQSVANILGNDKANDFYQASMSVFENCFQEDTLLNYVTDYIDQVGDNLKESAENVINNILSLRNTFSECKGKTFNLPNINFSSSSLKFNIPYISSAHIRCY